MILTERDKGLLHKIQSYGILTTNQICDLVFYRTAKTTVLRRLRALESAHYIQRIDRLRNYAIGWALTKKSAKMLSDKSSKIHFPFHLLDHEVELTALRIALEGRYIVTAWIPEHEIRSSMAKKYGIHGVRDRVVPDALGSVKVDGVQESIAVELELYGKNSRRYRQSFNGYCSKKNLWGVLYVVANPMIGRHLEKVWRKELYFGGPRFFWCTLEHIKMCGVSAPLNGVNFQRPISKIFESQQQNDLLGAHMDALRVSTPSFQN